MGLAKFFKLLIRRWYILILVPIISVACTYLLVKDLPGSYLSQAKISTGIVDETQRVLNVQNNVLQESQVNQEFSNLIEMMRLKKILDQVSYTLIIHDLTSPTPYKPPSKLMNQLTPAAKAHALEVYKDKKARQEELNLLDPDQKGLNLVLRSMKYDEESLRNQLTIYRVSNSDFIFVEFTSENAELSAFVVNELCNVFVAYYTNAVKENQYKAANYLYDLMQQKYKTMNEKIDGLKAYKIDNKILNLYEQSKILYTHLMLVSSQKEQAQKDIEAYDGAIQSIEAKFDPKDRRYFESSMTKITQEIIATKAQLNSFSDKEIQSNFQGTYKPKIDSLQKVLTAQINQSTDKYIYDPLSTKKDLIGQKLSLEVQRDIARNSLHSLSAQYDELNWRFNRLVPFEAVVQSYERDIDVSTREYLDVLNKFNQTKMESGFSVRLKQVQTGMPGMAQSSKKLILLLLAAIVSFVFCLLVFLLVFLFDSSINNANELVFKTQQPVLGHLNRLPKDFSGMYNIWYTNSSSPVLNEQKRLLRSIRFEIDRALTGKNRVLGVTSLTPQEGKSFLTINLAYAFAMMKKEVLLIDGNFNNPVITNALHPAQYIEDILETGQLNFKSEGLMITVAGNRGEESSVLEISREEKIRKLFDNLPFDIIIIETEALDTENKAKEWFLFSDKIVSVFDAGQNINDNDEQRIAYLESTNKFAGWVINNIKNKLKAQLKPAVPEI